MFRVTTIAVPLLLIVACQSEDAGIEIDVNGTGFEVDDGITARLALVDIVAEEIVDVAELTITDGAMAASWRDGVVQNTAYRIDAYIDVDGNDICEIGIDKTFAFDVVTGTVGINLGFMPASAGDSRGCLAFGGSSLSLEGQSFPPNQRLFAALVRVGDDLVLDVQHVMTDDGSFEVSWPGGIRPATFYRVDWFVDANANATCDVSPSEGPWRVSFGALGGDPSAVGITGGSTSMVVNGNDTSDSAACESFPDGV